MVNFAAESAEKREMAAVAQALHEGDDIVAGSDAVAEVEHFDGSLTRLDAGATAALQRIADPTGQAHLVLDLGPGASWHRTSPLRARGSKYEARTPAASALARSASFVVRRHDDGSGWFAALSGTVIVRGRAGGMVVLRAGETVSAAPDGSLAEVADRGVRSLATDEWVAVNAVLDADGHAVEPRPQPAPAVEAATEAVAEAEVGDDASDREHPWRVGVAAGLALALAVFSVVIGRAGTKQPAEQTERDPAIAVPGPPAFATPAVTAPRSATTAAPTADAAPAPVAEPAAAAPEAPTASITNKSCTRAGGGTVVYTGSLHNHAATTADFTVHVQFTSAKGSVVAATTATVSDVPAGATRTFRASGAAGGAATACEVSRVAPA